MEKKQVKKIVSLLMVISIYISSNAQSNFQDHTITTNALNAKSVYAADIDGDGDMDVLSASQSDDKIAWYENTNGQVGVISEQIITISAAGAWSVYAADIDGDGDIDVLSASIYDDKIAWYENTDGQGSFGPEQSVSTNAINARSVYAADLDGDGDMDVLSASLTDNKIAWYENTDGNGSFGTEQIITTNADGAWSVHSADLDGDGDMDVLSASFNDDKVAWYENTDGQGTFGAELIITTNADGIKSVYAADIDGDGDMDVLSASSSDDKIAWYENTNGQGNFGAEQIITTNADGASSVYASDIDGDGDMDVLAAIYFENKIAGYRNINGQGNFGPELIVTTNANGATSVYSTDLDGDGDMDVLSASSNDDKITGYENLSTTLSIDQNMLNNFSVYPNPTSGVLAVNSTTIIAQIDIYNQFGQLVLANSYQDEIDISVLSQGMFYCKIKDENGNIGVKKIVKN